VLLVLVIILTMPVWLVVGGVVFGVMVAVLGGIFGIIAGIFGALIGLILLPFKLLFHMGHWAWWPHFHFSGFFLVILIIILALAVRGRNS